MNDKEQVRTQLLNEGAAAGENGYALSRLFDPLIIAIEDDTAITQAMITPIEGKLREMQAQITRLQALLSELKVTAQQ